MFLYNDAKLKTTETEAKLLIQAPGFSREDLNISIEKDTLAIRGSKEIEGNKFKVEKYIELNTKELDLENIDASITNGLLIITIPRAKTSIPKLIKVN